MTDLGNGGFTNLYTHLLDEQLSWLHCTSSQCPTAQDGGWDELPASFGSQLSETLETHCLGLPPTLSCSLDTAALVNPVGGCEGEERVFFTWLCMKVCFKTLIFAFYSTRSAELSSFFFQILLYKVPPALSIHFSQCRVNS